MWIKQSVAAFFEQENSKSWNISVLECVCNAATPLEIVTSSSTCRLSLLLHKICQEWPDERILYFNNEVATLNVAVSLPHVHRLSAYDSISFYGNVNAVKSERFSFVILDSITSFYYESGKLPLLQKALDAVRKLAAENGALLLIGRCTYFGGPAYLQDYFGKNTIRKRV